MVTGTAAIEPVVIEILEAASGCMRPVLLGYPALVPEIRTERVAAHAIVVAPSGELDIVSATELVDVLDSAFATVPSVVLDLSEVTFIDSSIVGVLASTSRAVAVLPDARFAVVSPVASRTRRVIELVDEQFVGVFDDRSAALASMV